MTIKGSHKFFPCLMILVLPNLVFCKIFCYTKLVNFTQPFIVQAMAGKYSGQNFLTNGPGRHDAVMRLDQTEKE